MSCGPQSETAVISFSVKLLTFCASRFFALILMFRNHCTGGLTLVTEFLMLRQGLGPWIEPPVPPSSRRHWKAQGGVGLHDAVRGQGRARGSVLLATFLSHGHSLRAKAGPRGPHALGKTSLSLPQEAQPRHHRKSGPALSRPFNPDGPAWQSPSRRDNKPHWSPYR